MIFNNFLLPNQSDLSAHCFYHFLIYSQTKMQQDIGFPMEITAIKFQAASGFIQASMSRIQGLFKDF